MAKATTVFVCQECGFTHPKWVGQCSNCKAWNSLVEEPVVNSKTSSLGGTRREMKEFSITFPEVDSMKASKKRFSTQIDELDRVLGMDDTGSGMVPGAVVLIGGEPGIGKSTLLTQMVVSVLNSQKSTNQKSILYISGEENPSQIALRINRLASRETTKKFSDNSQSSQLTFVTSTNVEEIGESIVKIKPLLVIVDSIQTLTSASLTGSAGSVGQVRECTEQLTTIAKAYDIPTFLVGHVTKEGEFAGPKVLEHIVDSVLEFSGERTGDFRMLRAIKNRFGATDEVGVFKMTEYGFESVTNPSLLFLEHADKPVAGSATACLLEGTRPLLVEVQALVQKSFLAMPRRVGRGVELSKLQVLAAVLQKHCSYPFDTHDMFVSVAGGFTAREPAVDLGVALALASSFKNKSLPAQTVCIGEVGLLGEIRTVPYLERRIKEVERLGFKNIISRNSHPTVLAALTALHLTKKS